MIDDRERRRARVVELVERDRDETRERGIGQAASPRARGPARRAFPSAAACRTRAPGPARGGDPAHRAPAARLRQAPRAASAPSSTRRTTSAASRCASCTRFAARSCGLRPEARARSNATPGDESGGSHALARPPAGISSMRNAAAPQATTRPLRSAVTIEPAGACAASGTGSARQTLTSSPSRVVLAPGTGSKARTCRSMTVAVAVQIDGGLGLVDLRGIGGAGRAVAALPAPGAPAASRRRTVDNVRAHPRPPAFARASPRVSRAPIGTRTTSSIGPVSSPASISHDRDAGLGVARQQRALDRRRAAPPRQQRRVHVDAAVPRPRRASAAAAAGRRRRPRGRRAASRRAAPVGVARVASAAAGPEGRAPVPAP